MTDVAVGDEAFACMSGMGPQGQMYTHRVLISINVNGAEDDAAGVADAADLLMLVTVPPVDRLKPVSRRRRSRRRRTTGPRGR